MNNRQAIKVVEQQFNDAKKWQHLLQDQQTEEDFKHAVTGIHAIGIVLDLARERVKELEE